MIRLLLQSHHNHMVDNFVVKPRRENPHGGFLFDLTSITRSVVCPIDELLMQIREEMTREGLKRCEEYFKNKEVKK